jgi:hypothetical protein
VDRLFRAWERSHEPGAHLIAAAFHSDRARHAGSLRERILEREPNADVAMVEVNASLASHTGPGLLGLAWVWDPYTHRS